MEPVQPPLSEYSLHDTHDTVVIRQGRSNIDDRSDYERGHESPLYLGHERRPFQGDNLDARVPLFKDERPWIRWPVTIILKPPLHIFRKILPSRGEGRDNTIQQLNLLLSMSQGWIVSVVLCGIYIAVTIVWEKKGPQNEAQRKVLYTITTGISIALGLNIARCYNDMALYIRWPILSAKWRNLDEVNSILHPGNRSNLLRLALDTRRPWVIFICTCCILLSLLQQAGIALLNLTYGFSTSDKDLIPSQEASLKFEHRYVFYLIIGIICGSHLLFIVVTAVFTNGVKLGPDDLVGKALLLRPIADALEGVSGGRDNRDLRAATRVMRLRYRRARDGRWIFAKKGI